MSAKSLTALGAVINFETAHSIFRDLEPETVVQLERSPTGHLWLDLFERMPVVSNVTHRQLSDSCPERWRDNDVSDKNQPEVVQRKKVDSSRTPPGAGHRVVWRGLVPVRIRT